MENLARMMAMMGAERPAPPPKTDYKFWKTQPVMQLGEQTPSEASVIHENMPPERVRQDAYPLPADFQWVQVDIEDAAQLKDVYDLLTANYVEDDDESLRFNYSPEFLKWVLRHPGYRPTWHVGVRVKSTGKLVAFIAGIPQELRVREQTFQTTEINFLCVHKRLRSKRLAPVMIKEVTRQCHLTGIFQAIYTVGSVLPTPVSCARYYHRTLNAEKLLDIGFSAVPHGMSRAEHIRRFVLPDATSVPGLREMRVEDVPAVGRLMRRYMRRFDMAPRFTDTEVAHVLLSGRGEEQADGQHKGQVTWTYVVDDEETGGVRDMFSFYSLPSSVLNHPKHRTLQAAYLFYYASDSIFRDPATGRGGVPPRGDVAAGPSPMQRAVDEGVPAWQRSDRSALSPPEAQDEEGVAPWDQEDPAAKAQLKRRLNELMRDMLVIAKRNAFDVVNCLTVMDNALFAQEQKFGPGDGFLRFYLFNWRVAPIAGGMGSRPGEEELDPAGASSPSPTVRGSGNGVVMV